MRLPCDPEMCFLRSGRSERIQTFACRNLLDMKGKPEKSHYQRKECLCRVRRLDPVRWRMSYMSRTGRNANPRIHHNQPSDGGRGGDLTRGNSALRVRRVEAKSRT